MFSRKRVRLREYCVGKLDFLFSPEGHSLADDLKNRCGSEFAVGVNQAMYLAHFRGAFLELLGVAFSRTLKRDQRYDVTFLEKEYLESKGYPELDDIHRLYNSAFGSSFVDGVEQMAQCFAEQNSVQGVDSVSVAKTYYDGFYEILEGLFGELGKIRVIS